jgi:hypothetical protein
MDSLYRHGLFISIIYGILKYITSKYINHADPNNNSHKNGPVLKYLLREMLIVFISYIIYIRGFCNASPVDAVSQVDVCVSGPEF